MANYFMQGGDGKEYGPVGAEQLRQWVAEGRANGQTQVRLAEGGPYLALGAVPELSLATSMASVAKPSAFAPDKGSAEYFMRGGDGKEYGPVSAAQLRQWVAEGRANGQTQVRAAEGGAFRALGMVPELNAGGGGVTRYSSPGGAYSMAHTLAQNSGQAGMDSTLLVKRLAEVLSAGASWMKFLAVLSWALAGIAILGSSGLMLIVAWAPIWLGVVLWKAAAMAQQAAFTGTEADLAQALEQLRFYFKLSGILRILAVIGGAVVLIFFFAAMMAMVSGMGLHSL